MTVHLLVPDGVDDPLHPSGGNVYDRQLAGALAGSGWSVRELAVAPAAVADALAQVPDDGTVLVDGLTASTAVAPLLAQVRRLRLVVLVHLPFEVDGERELLAEAAAVVATSRWTRDWLVEHYRLAPGAVRVAAPGTEPAAPATRHQAGDRLLCVAPLSTAKGCDDLVHALAAVRDLRWRCTWAGALDVDPDATSRVLTALDRHGLAHRVRLTGPLARADLAAAYAAADLLVHPSRQETFGMVLAEAVACAVPVVATAVGGTPEALGGPDAEVPGLLVPPEDPARLADALRRWLVEPELRRQLRRTAARRRTQLPTWGDTTDEVAATLRAVNLRPSGSV